MFIHKLAGIHISYNVTIFQFINNDAANFEGAIFARKSAAPIVIHMSQTSVSNTSTNGEEVLLPNLHMTTDENNILGHDECLLYAICKLLFEC